MIKVENFNGIIKYYYNLFLLDCDDSLIVSFDNDIDHKSLYANILTLVNKKTSSELDVIIERISDMNIFFEDKTSCLDTLEIIQELRKYDMKIISIEAVKTYTAKLICDFIYSHVNTLKKQYSKLNSMLYYIKEKNINLTDPNCISSIETKNHVRMLFHLRNCLIDLMQYKFLKLFMYNFSNCLKDKDLSNYNNIQNGGKILSNYITYVECMSNMNHKILNKFNTFNSLSINKEIEYFINNFNPKYNKIHKELISENNADNVYTHYTHYIHAGEINGEKTSAKKPKNNSLFNSYKEEKKEAKNSEAKNSEAKNQEAKNSLQINSLSTSFTPAEDGCCLDGRGIFIKQFSENPNKMLAALSFYANRSDRNMAVVLTILDIIANATSVFSKYAKTNTSVPSSNIVFNIHKDGIDSVKVNENVISFTEPKNIKDK